MSLIQTPTVEAEAEKAAAVAEGQGRLFRDYVSRGVHGKPGRLARRRRGWRPREDQVQQQHRDLRGTGG